MQAANSTVPISLSRIALPISTLMYLCKIIATISVPPVDAPMLNTMPLARAGSATAKHSSSRVSSVKGRDMGNSFSNILE